MAVARANGRNRTASIQRVFLGLLGANLAVVGAKLVIGIGARSLSVIGDAILGGLLSRACVPRVDPLVVHSEPC